MNASGGSAASSDAGGDIGRERRRRPSRTPAPRIRTSSRSRSRGDRAARIALRSPAGSARSSSISTSIRVSGDSIGTAIQIEPAPQLRREGVMVRVVQPRHACPAPAPEGEGQQQQAASADTPPRVSTPGERRQFGPRIAVRDRCRPRSGRRDRRQGCDRIDRAGFERKAVARFDAERRGLDDSRRGSRPGPRPPAGLRSRRSADPIIATRAFARRRPSLHPRTRPPDRPGRPAAAPFRPSRAGARARATRI